MGTAVEQDVACPKCGGRTWDNRLSKKNPAAPDYKCRDRNCDGVIWPPRGQAAPRAAAPAAPAAPPANAKQAHTIGAPIPGLDTATPESVAEAYRPFIKAAVRLMRDEVDAAGVPVTADAVHACAFSLFKMATGGR